MKKFVSEHWYKLLIGSALLMTSFGFMVNPVSPAMAYNYNDKVNLNCKLVPTSADESMNVKLSDEQFDKTVPKNEEGSINIKITEDQIPDWTGTYVDKFKRTLKITGPASDGAVKFELTPQNNASCEEGPMEGTAYLTSSAVANYQEDGSECYLNFTFNTGQIEVNEYDCDHGASCGTLDGIYTKKK
jgi:hypothetical protein